MVFDASKSELEEELSGRFSHLVGSAGPYRQGISRPHASLVRVIEHNVEVVSKRHLDDSEDMSGLTQVLHVTWPPPTMGIRVSSWFS